MSDSADSPPLKKSRRTVDQNLFEFILEACAKLELSVLTTASASVFYHRCTQSKELKELCQNTLAAVCIHLASKSQEDRAKIRDVINVTYRILHADEPAMDLKDRYWAFRHGLGRMEFVVLRALHFDLNVDCPHKYFLHYASSVRGYISRDQMTLFDRAVAAAYTCLKDSFVLPSLPLSHPPRVYALGVLSMLFRHFRLRIRSDWARVLLPGVKENALRNVAADFERSLYRVRDVLPNA